MLLPDAHQVAMAAVVDILSSGLPATWPKLAPKMRREAGDQPLTLLARTLDKDAISYEKLDESVLLALASVSTMAAARAGLPAPCARATVHRMLVSEAHKVLRDAESPIRIAAE